ncbi:YqcI/YcgG family protein [Stieleria marina]|uniref:YqcI/YcgG family protein n=1 Tax=Stieleria marina TaxID=1930275 RepID=A0A517P0J8_9BACT|nr:YqcI/YcgG family protein [Planctomycetes bacterium K23_9]
MTIESLSPDGVTPLWKKSQIELALADCKLPSWVQKSYDAFVETMRGDDFPCFFGVLAEQKELIRYAIAPSLTTPEALDCILESVYAYLEEERRLEEFPTGEDPLYLTLVVFFPIESESRSLDHYAEQAFSVLNALHRRDRMPWPDDIPSDPSDSHWRYCLGGRKLFVNVCTPANHNRRSRNLGPGLTMVINPEDVFQKVWERWGEEPRRKIYKRMESYDRIPPHPLVRPWDKGEREDERNHLNTKITVLADRNDSEFEFPFQYVTQDQKQGACPFHQSSSTSDKQSK